MTREEKMNKRREAGKTYRYKANPFPKGTHEHYMERLMRSFKENTSHKPRISNLKSVMAKLDNRIAKEKEERVKRSKKLVNES